MARIMITPLGHQRPRFSIEPPGLHQLYFATGTYQSQAGSRHTVTTHITPGRAPVAVEHPGGGPSIVRTNPKTGESTPSYPPGGPSGGGGHGGGRAPFRTPTTLVSLLSPVLSTLGLSHAPSSPGAPAVPTPLVVPPGLERKTVGSPSLEEIIQAGRQGQLGMSPGGGLTTPAVRRALGDLRGARSRLLGHALPDTSGLSGPEREILPYALRAHRLYPDIPVSVLMAQDKQESGFNPLAESSAGAFGTSQFIPSTAASYGVQRGNSPRAIQSQLTGQAHLLHDEGFSSDPQGALSSYSGGYAAAAYNNPILADARANYAGLDRPTRVPGAVRQDYHLAATQARRLGVSVPSQRQVLTQGPSSSVPYHAFNAHVARELHLVKAGKYDQGAGSLVLNPGVEIGQGHEPEIAARLKLLSAKLGKPVYIISGHRSPQHSVEVGGFSNDPHTKGIAADIGIGSASRDSVAEVPEALFESVGLHRPFYPQSAAEVNHVQLLNGGSPATGGGVGGGVGGLLPSSAAGAALVSAPGVPGSTSPGAGAQQGAGVSLAALAPPVSAGPLLPEGFGAGEDTTQQLLELLAARSPARRTRL